jgi:hypothetical protein
VVVLSGVAALAEPYANERGAGLERIIAGVAGTHLHRASATAPRQLGADRVLPVLPELRELLPGRGLRRGATVGVGTRARPDRPAWSVGTTSLLLALLAEASRAGSWCAVVGVPSLGAAAAAELGIALDRFALVPQPGPDWATVVAALLEGVDIVVAAPPGPVTAAVTGRLAARARQRGSVLVAYGGWSGVDVTLQAVRGVWQGLSRGRGRLTCRELTIAARGRGAAAIPREVRVWLPKLSGLAAELAARRVGPAALVPAVVGPTSVPSIVREASPGRRLVALPPLAQAG